MSSTIGQLLSKEREARALTIDQASSATHIRPHYLRAIESDEFEALPSIVHARGFLRAYADFLGVDPEPFLPELNGENETAIVSPTSEIISPSDSVSPKHQSQPIAAEIFKEVGEVLLHQREMLGLSLDDVERHTHLRQHYLLALETGDLENLPSPVQGRGMLNNYASFLGLNPEPVLLRFADGLQAQLEARRAAQPKSRLAPIRERNAPPSLFRRLFSADILIGGVLVFSLLTFIFWGIIRIVDLRSDTQPIATAPSIAEVLLATPTPTETPTSLPATPTNPPQVQLFPTLPLSTGTPGEGETPPAGGGAAVQVYLTVRQRAWMRVIVDGEVQFDGRVIPGSAYPFVGDSQVEVLTGNGAALQIFFNGTDLGLLGDQSEIIDQIYTPQGVFIPTPTMTSTPSVTPAIPATTTNTGMPLVDTPTVPAPP
jgi:cytoskeleton protein RodZ